MTKAKILLLDIETAPSKVYTWGLWDQNVGLNQIIQDEYMLCWCAKWLGERKIHFDSIVNYKKEFKRDPASDKKLAQSIWNLMDEADIVITHNGDKFDIKWLNTLFLKHKLSPVSTFRSIDTLKETRGNFRLVSYKLEYLLRRLGIGEKMKHEGFGLWTKCMAGDRGAWRVMEKYNRRDVTELEKLYEEIKPFIKHHPNLSLYTDSNELACPNCGSTDNRVKGYAFTSTNKFRRYKCNHCGKQYRGRQGLLSKEQRQALGSGA